MGHCRGVLQANDESGLGVDTSKQTIGEAFVYERVAELGKVLYRLHQRAVRELGADHAAAHYICAATDALDDAEYQLRCQFASRNRIALGDPDLAIAEHTAAAVRVIEGSAPNLHTARPAPMPWNGGAA